MKINEFVTSDLHIGHQNILKFCPERAYSIKEMHSKIIRRYNSVVRKNDVCWFLGDIGMGNKEEVESILKQLNGRKLLILGNHDKGSNSMYSLGFDAVMYNATRIIAKQIVTMSHCPLLGIKRENTEGFNNEHLNEDWHGSSRKKNRKYIVENKGQFHLHGHIHSPNNGRSLVKQNRQWDVGLDGNNMTPVSTSQIESWIVKTIKEEESINI